MSTPRKIVTRHVCPPIPIRDYDWCAYEDGQEEAGNYGWGCTEAEAVADWHEVHEDSGICKVCDTSFSPKRTCGYGGCPHDGGDF